MTDIILSCVRRDRKRAEGLADSLRTRGYSVAILKSALAALNPFAKSQTEKGSAKVIITLWSPHSVASERMIAEADDSRWRQKYVGVLMSPNLELPLSFDVSQAVEMTGERPEWVELDTLCDRLGTLIDAPAPETASALRRTLSEKANAETAIWEKIGEGGSISGYEFYLKQYGKKGEFAVQARAKIKELTTWRYRLGQFAGSRLVAGAAVLALVLGGASLFAMSRHNANASNAVTNAQYAELEARTAELEAKLADANRSRVGLIASFSEKVSREEYAALNDRAAELEKQLAEANGIYAPIENASLSSGTDDLGDATYAPYPGAMDVAALSSEIDLPTGVASVMDIPAESFGGDKVSPASATSFECTVDGAVGVSFGSTCWPRSANKLVLDGFGIETATNLEPVKMLRELEELDIAGAWLSDLSPLSSMGSLRRINIAGTTVKSLDAIAPLQQLELLDLAGTEIADLSPLKDMTMLSTFCPPNERCIIDDAEKVQRYLDQHAR
jgi:hypothetical protein